MAKILLIHHSGVIGGAGVSLNNMMKALRDENELYVAVSTEPDDMVKLFRSDPSNTVIPYGRRIGALTFYSGGDSAFSPRFVYRALLIPRQKKTFDRMIAQVDPDIVVVNSMTTSWLGRLGEVKKRKSVCFVRETFRGAGNHPVNRYIKSCLEHFSKVIFLSDYDKRAASLKKASSEVLYNYIVDNQFDRSVTKKQACEKLGVDDSGFLVLFVGGVSSIKGFDVAARAVLSSDKNIRLIVAGNDFSEAARIKDRKERAYFRRWEEYIRANDPDGRIRFVGRQLDMSYCYACADAVIFPMREPHQARPAFEAGFFRKPIIITDCENIREFVTDGYNGLTAENENVEAFREKIELLAGDEALKNRLGMNNYDRYLRNHSQKAALIKLKEVIAT